MRYLTIFLLALFSCTATNSDLQQASNSKSFTQGIVSSAHPIATQAGINILQKGGNAFDAAVAIASTLNVVEPMMSGVGGYGTILIYDATNKQTRFLDSSGKIPMLMNSDLMRPPTPEYLENRRGAKSISTPGNVNAWHAMSSDYGKLAWAELFDDAIAAANDGFEISERTARLIGIGFEEFPDHAKAFYGNGGQPLQKGAMLVQKDLATSLRKIASEGKSVFYEGEIGKAIDEEMQARESFLRLSDLQNDRAEYWEPIKIDYNGYEVYTASPPANAFPSLIRLGIMKQYADLGLAHNGSQYLHRFAEATKHAFWCRLKYAGDPEVSPPPLDSILSENYFEVVSAAISSQDASDFEYPGIADVESKNTTHFVVADKWGNIVSATQTLGNLFGSKIMPEGTGIWLNNSLAYSTYEPKGNPMDAIPGQRKLSGDCPTIIFKDGLPWAALGTPGGHTIGQTVPQMVMNLIDFSMDIENALSAPRVSFIEPNDLAIEQAIHDSIGSKLEEMGHNIRKVRALGNAHGLTINYNEKGEILGFEGAADPRGEGTAQGF